MAEPDSTLQAKRRGLVARGWRNLRAAGARRLLLTAALLVGALVLAIRSWSIPVLDDAERSLYDLRAYLSAPRVEQDPRLQIVVYDDQTLIDARKRSPLDRGLLAKALRNLDTMGAKAIGIDILFDQVQDEDDELVRVLRAMKTPVFIAYTTIQGNRDDITFDQQKYLDSFMARLKGSNAHPASIQLNYAHGVARDWPRLDNHLPMTLSRAMLQAAGEPNLQKFSGYEGAIRYRIPWSDDRPVFSSLRIDLFADPQLAPALAGEVAGRYVLVGGDIVDTDRVETSLSATTGQSVPGIQVHAAMLAQMLDGAAPAQLPRWALVSLSLLVVIAASLTSLLEWRLWRVLPFVLVQASVFGGLPFFLQARGLDTQGTPAVGWIVAWIIAYAAVSSAARASGAEQRRFAHSALGKYLPRDIAEQIIENPELLALYGTKQDLYILFSDLEGFTKLSHMIPPETVAKLLNEYLETLSQVVLEHGGVIDKFVGDAVVAFWGAPIARPDDAEKAARAGYAMWQAGEAFRRGIDPSLPPVGKTRVGLHFGEAIVGNFGGERRIQYTALGDSMNTASRLESANKSLDTSVIASREFAERSGLDWWRPMGRVVLRGRSRPVEIFEPTPDFPADDRAELARAMELVDSDRNAAIAMLRALTARYPSDAALQNLLKRAENLGEGSAYVLD